MPLNNGTTDNVVPVQSVYDCHASASLQPVHCQFSAVCVLLQDAARHNLVYEYVHVRFTMTNVMMH
jgi:hypothetical protein